MSVLRRLEVLEEALGSRKPAENLEADQAALAAKFEAWKRSRAAYAAMSTGEKIAALTAQLRELQARPADRLVTYQVRMVEISIDELHGVAAEVCEEARLRAIATLSGRRYEEPGEWAPPPPMPAEGDPVIATARDLQHDVEHRGPAVANARRMRDVLRDYRGGQVRLEPEWP
jgi:hypothetical protein